ncbi:MAG: hypothetical protein DLM70_04785 [Chloroflexi bacterium]|nr:MAG: hypothetical protein DLM70_04785 [Chloroflexota bacterium]
MNLTIASGTTLTGATIATGSFYCVQAQFNAPGQIVAAVFVTSTSTTASLNVCGSISTFTAASATAAGQVIIGGQSFSVAPGVTFTGATPATGGIFCLSAVFNASSQLNSGSFSAPLAAAEINSLQGAGGYRVGRSYND